LQASVKSSVSARTIQRVAMDRFKKNAPALPRRRYADFCNKIRQNRKWIARCREQISPRQVNALRLDR
jgi:ligand-binding sensor protein